MSAPVVAVIVPVHNGAAFLEDTLESIADQTLGSLSCVIVDDGSTDDTASVARRMVDRDPRFRLVRQTNAGTPAARNAGLATVSEQIRYVSFVDGDDVLVPDALAVLIEALDEHPEAVGSYGLAEYMTSTGAPYARGLHPKRQRDRRRLGRVKLTPVPSDEPYTWSSLIVSGTLWPSAVALHRRAIVDRVGRFDAALRQVQDWDLYLRMSRHGPFVPVDAQVAWYRQHASNATSRTERVAFYSMLVRRRASTSQDNTAHQRREVRRVTRRLAARWTVWSAQSALTALRRRDPAASGVAARSTLAFAHITATGRPPEPTDRLAMFVARFVMTRHPHNSVLAGVPEQ